MPKVQSAVVRLRPLTESERVAMGAPKDAAMFARVVNAAFSMRRKTLRNALASMIDAPSMERLGIDPGLRFTGFGVLEKTGSRLQYIASGCVSTQRKDGSEGTALEVAVNDLSFMSPRDGGGGTMRDTSDGPLIEHKRGAKPSNDWDSGNGGGSDDIPF